MYRADAQSHPMQTDRIVIGQAPQHMQIPATGPEVVLGMHFKPVDGRQCLQKVGVMRSAQTNTNRR